MYVYIFIYADGDIQTYNNTDNVYSLYSMEFSSGPYLTPPCTFVLVTINIRGKEYKWDHNVRDTIFS